MSQYLEEIPEEPAQVPMAGSNVETADDFENFALMRAGKVCDCVLYNIVKFFHETKLQLT